MRPIALLTLCLATLTSSAFAQMDTDTISMQKQFADLDTDNDGYLSADEVKDTLGMEFTAIDNNVDGLISPQEYTGFARLHSEHGDSSAEPVNSAMSPTEQQMVEDAKEHAIATNEFDTMDIDKDGTVSKEEALEMGVSETFAEMDGDGDQIITRVEYTRYREAGHNH